MTKLNIYTIDGAEHSQQELDVDQCGEVNEELVTSYIYAYRANQRQHTANTKSRGEVRGSTKKIRKQKGTGRARAGSIRTPQRRGGGRAHGPKSGTPNLSHVNTKERKVVRKTLMAEMIKGGGMVVLKDPRENELPAPSTKTLVQFLSALNLRDSRVSFVCGSDQHSELDAVRLSIRNIDNVTFRSLGNINAFDIAKEKKLVLLESALPELKEMLISRKELDSVGGKNA